MLNTEYDYAHLKNKAIFECQKCKHKFKADPGPQICVKCHHIWLNWLNYWQLFK